MLALKLMVATVQEARRLRNRSRQWRKQKTKNAYNQAMTQGNLVLQSIQNDPSWEQFRGHGEEKLTKAMKTLNDKVGASDFNKKKAIMMELAQLRKTMECAVFDTGCKQLQRRTR